MSTNMSTIRRTTNGFVQSLNDLTPEDLNPLSMSSTNVSIDTDTASSGFLGSFSFWIILILILALLGINIFTYLAKGTQEVTSIFAPVLKLFGYQTLETTKQTIAVSAEGAKTSVGIVANTTTGAIDAVQPNNVVSSNKPSYKSDQSTNKSTINAETVNNKLNDLEDEQIDGLDKALRDASRTSNIVPDDAQSSIQSVGKAGWCYIGDDKNVRVCSKIGVNDKCLSGDIFPSQDICMNPTLRA